MNLSFATFLLNRNNKRSHDAIFYCSTKEKKNTHEKPKLSHITDVMRMPDYFFVPVKVLKKHCASSVKPTFNTRPYSKYSAFGV